MSRIALPAIVLCVLALFIEKGLAGPPENARFFESPCDVGVAGSRSVVLTPNIVYLKDGESGSWRINVLLGVDDKNVFFRLAGGSDNCLYVVGTARHVSTPRTDGFSLLKVVKGKLETVRTLPSQLAAFTNETVGVCLNDGGLELTTDGGKTWQKTTLKLQTSAAVQDLQWVSPTRLLVICGDGYTKLLTVNETTLKDAWEATFTRPATRAAAVGKNQLVLAGNCRVYYVDVESGKLLQELKTDIITRSVAVVSGEAWVCGSSYVDGQPRNKITRFHVQNDKLSEAGNYSVTNAQFIFPDGDATSVIGVTDHIFTLAKTKKEFIPANVRIDNAEAEKAMMARQPDPRDLPTREDWEKLDKLADKVASETRQQIADRASQMKSTAKERVQWMIGQYEEAAKHPDPKNPPVTRQMVAELESFEKKFTQKQMIEYGQRIAKEQRDYDKKTYYQQFQIRLDLARRMVAEAEKDKKSEATTEPQQ